MQCEIDSGTDSDTDYKPHGYIPVSYRNREYESESESVQCEMFCMVQCSHRV